MTDEPLQCQFIGNEGAGLASEFEKNKAIKCEADAQVVVRLRKPRTSANGLMNLRKTPVCKRHGAWLQESNEVEIDWEICGTVEDEWGEND